jgi:hypothetical protein
MVENGVNPEMLGGKYNDSLHIWDLRERRHLQSLDSGAEQQMALELRAAHDPTKAYGFVGVVTSLKDLFAFPWFARDCATRGRFSSIQTANPSICSAISRPMTVRL